MQDGGGATDRRAILAARLVAVLARSLDRVAQTTELTIPQYRFLLTLKRGPRRASDLAAISGITRATASALVSDAERKGLIHRTRDAEDGRAAELRLTDKGLRLFAELDDALAACFESHLPNDGREAILDAFGALAAEVDRRGHRPAAADQARGGLT